MVLLASNALSKGMSQQKAGWNKTCLNIVEIIIQVHAVDKIDNKLCLTCKIRNTSQF